MPSQFLTDLSLRIILSRHFNEETVHCLPSKHPLIHEALTFLHPHHNLPFGPSLHPVLFNLTNKKNSRDSPHPGSIA